MRANGHPEREKKCNVLSRHVSYPAGRGGDALHGRFETGIRQRPTSSMLRPLAVRSAVYAQEGSLLAVLHAGEDRALAKRDQVPEVLRHVMVDVEYEFGLLRVGASAADGRPPKKSWNASPM